MNDAYTYPHPSRRVVVYGSKGMAATSQPLAAQAALDTLKAGGNAVDAAISAAMALTVLEPTSNGIGSDAFCIAWVKGKMYGLNASGTAPGTITAEAVRQMGHDVMPSRGFIPVTVPGAPSAWAALSSRFGRLPLTKTAEPAITYAKEGYPVSPGTAEGWSIAQKAYAKRMEPGLYEEWSQVFTINGEAPGAGRVWRSPAHAETLRLIAESNAEEFYKYTLADKIHNYFKANGGFLTKEDLAGYAPEWVEPVTANYRGLDVWEIPPNGQGLVALMALNILNKMDIPSREADRLHVLIETVKLAFAEGQRHIADPSAMRASVTEMLSEGLAAERRALIGRTAINPEAVPFHDYGTVYLCTADGEGNMVSYIQSNYQGFGSGVVIPGTGIAMQNRGANFSLDPAHPNCLAPGKRPYHTIIPGFLTKNGEALGPFGIMGGFMQPQAHVQVLSGLADMGLNPQAALDAPRWQWLSGKKVSLETGIPGHVAAELRRRGHEVEYSVSQTPFGRGQMILKNPPELGFGYTGATEPRADGTVAAW